MPKRQLVAVIRMQILHYRLEIARWRHRSSRRDRLDPLREKQAAAPFLLSENLWMHFSNAILAVYR
jgi:hypothetical protein